MERRARPGHATPPWRMGLAISPAPVAIRIGPIIFEARRRHRAQLEGWLGFGLREPSSRMHSRIAGLISFRKPQHCPAGLHSTLGSRKKTAAGETRRGGQRKPQRPHVSIYPNRPNQPPPALVARNSRLGAGWVAGSLAPCDLACARRMASRGLLPIRRNGACGAPCSRGRRVCGLAIPTRSLRAPKPGGRQDQALTGTEWKDQRDSLGRI